LEPLPASARTGARHFVRDDVCGGQRGVGVLHQPVVPPGEIGALADVGVLALRIAVFPRTGDQPHVVGPGPVVLHHAVPVAVVPAVDLERGDGEPVPAGHDTAVAPEVVVERVLRVGSEGVGCHLSLPVADAGGVDTTVVDRVLVPVVNAVHR